MTTLELLPFNVAPNAGSLADSEGSLIYEPLGTIGDGGLADDSDASGVQMGAWGDVDGNHVERFSADFTTPAGFTPTAALIRMRAKNDPDVLASPPEGLRLLYQAIATTDDATIHAQQLGNTAAAWWPLGPLTVPEVSTPTWFDWYWQAHPDLANPTEDGEWLELAYEPDALTALTGAGLRVTLGWTWTAETARRAWLNIYEIRLLVAGAFAGGPKPLRQHPRTDGLGASSARRVWPPSRGILRGSLRQGPGAIP